MGICKMIDGTVALGFTVLVLILFSQAHGVILI